eukprot:scaffold13458_cov75-Phaeocystis_antarctica.AAC.1
MLAAEASRSRGRTLWYRCRARWLTCSRTCAAAPLAHPHPHPHPNPKRKPALSLAGALRRGSLSRAAAACAAPRRRASRAQPRRAARARAPLGRARVAAPQPRDTKRAVKRAAVALGRRGHPERWGARDGRGRAGAVWATGAARNR